MNMYHIHNLQHLMNQSAIFVLDVPLMKPFLSTIPNGIPHKDNCKEINNGFLEAVYLINMLLCTTLEHLLWIIMYRTLWAVDIYILLIARIDQSDTCYSTGLQKQQVMLECQKYVPISTRTVISVKFVETRSSKKLASRVRQGL